MTREEFNNRTNTNATADEYNFIERVYMAAGDTIDKDQFCNDFNKTGITPTIAALTENVEAAQAKIKGQQELIQHLTIFIAEQAEETSCGALRNKAIALMGAKAYITWKIENDKTLWKRDLDLIKDLIN